MFADTAESTYYLLIVYRLFCPRAVGASHENPNLMTSNFNYDNIY